MHHLHTVSTDACMQSEMNSILSTVCQPHVFLLKHQNTEQKKKKNTAHILPEAHSRPPHLVQSLACVLWFLHEGFYFLADLYHPSKFLFRRGSPYTDRRRLNSLLLYLGTQTTSITHVHREHLQQEAISLHLSTPAANIKHENKNKWYAKRKKR